MILQHHCVDLSLLFSSVGFSVVESSSASCLSFVASYSVVDGVVVCLCV
jgi:hypothetical protein